MCSLAGHTAGPAARVGSGGQRGSVGDATPGRGRWRRRAHTAAVGTGQGTQVRLVLRV